jgi:dihydropyrimidine dehydrogenase (NAD+) subunit PreA
MAKLEVEFLGKKLSSPFWIASGAYQTVGSVIEKWVDVLAENHWSGVVTKSYLGTRPLESWLKPYFWTTPTYHSVAMQNLGPSPVPLGEDEMKGLRRSVRKCHENGIVIIGNIIGTTIPEWVELAKRIEDTGCDGVELNFGCPASPIKGHPTLQERYRRFFEAIEGVREKTTLPILAKINAQVLDRVEMASECKRAGADGISAINTVGGIIGIDIDTGIPISSDIDDVAVMSGLSGPLIKPIGLRVVAEIASRIDIPVCGIGGISRWKDVVEYIMVGATVVQVCTAAMWKGFSVGETMYKGLKRFLEDKRYGSLSDFRGISLKYFQREPSSKDLSVFASIDSSLCSKCHACYVACHEGAYGAIEVIRKEYRVKREVCQGCGLCRIVCPKGAIELHAVGFSKEKNR